MGFFGTSKRNDDLPTNEAVASEVDWEAHVEELAVKAEADWRAKESEIVAAIKADHARDLKSYKFNVRRFGDFLAFEITREGVKFENWYFAGWQPISLAFSVKLENGDSIKLNAGLAPGSKKPAGFILSKRRIDDPKWAGRVGSCDKLRAPGKGWEYVVKLRERHSKAGRIFVEPERSTRRNEDCNVSYIGDDAYHIKHAAVFPDYADDDTITFGVNGGTLCVPHGMGRKVYERILRTIAGKAKS